MIRFNNEQKYLNINDMDYSEENICSSTFPCMLYFLNFVKTVIQIFVLYVKKNT